MRRWLMLCVAAGALCWMSASAAQEPGKGELKLTEKEQEILRLTNEARQKANLPLVKPNPVLFRVARAHSANMARQQKIDHNLDGKKPRERVKEAGYIYHHTGENLAWGDLEIREVFDGWMKSKAHRDNILRKEFREIGLGCAVDKEGYTYYTQVFGSPKKQQ